MKKFIKYTMVFALVMFGFQVQAKDKARLSVDYNNVVGVERYLEITAKFKGEDGYQPAVKLPLNIYLEFTEDSLVIQGKTMTDDKGMAKFVLQKLPLIPDSLVKYIFVVKIEDDKNFKNASKSVKFFDSSIKAQIVEDSISFVSAVFMDGLGDPIKKKKLEVNVKRLFAPLPVGDSPYKTNQKGEILVSMADSLPGVDGILTIEVSHNSKKYGTVKFIIDAPIGKVVKDESTYDERTMWSPPNKTPWIFIIIPGFLILGVWTVIVLLLSNLIKIYKS